MYLMFSVRGVSAVCVIQQCCWPGTVAEAVHRVKGEACPQQGVGAVAAALRRCDDKHAPVPAGGVPAPARAAPSPAPQARPQICSCITCRMGNLPLRHW